MKTAAVWGASGFVGRHLVGALLAAGWQVRALMRDAGNTTDLPQDVERIVVPFTANATQMTAALAGAEVVFHCAGNPDATVDELANFKLDAARFAQSAAASGARRLIQLSTVAVYGAGSGGPVGPEHPLAGSSAYARSRIAAEAAVREELRGGATRCAIVRVPMVIGPGMRSDALRFFFSTLNTGIFFHPGGRDAVLNCIGVTRLCGLLVALADQPAAEPDGVYQFADNITWMEIARIYTQQAGRPVMRVRIPQALARLGLRLLLERDTRDGLTALANTMTYADDAARIGFDPHGAPTTKKDIAEVARQFTSQA